MIMMDVGSMYGQHSTPSYNPSDTNYYNYSSNAGDLSSHSLGHHQYTGGASGYAGGSSYHTGNHYEDGPYLYGVGGASTDSGVDTPPSPQDLNYYAHQPTHQETSVINTETGLSYTNLDYANSNGSIYHHQQPGYSESPYSGRPPHELLIRHSDDSSDQNQYLHDTKYPPHQLDHGEGYHHHPHIISTQTNASCMEYQHLQSRYKEEILCGDGRLRQHHGMHGLVAGQSQQPALPTYKWMQVKRNVPKPSVQQIITDIDENDDIRSRSCRRC